MVALAREVEAEWFTVLAGGLGSDGVADQWEVAQLVEFGQDMGETELHLLLGVEAVQGTGFEVVESVVGWSKEGHALVGVVELVFDLASDLGGGQELDECGVLATFV